ncbi:hypothetical protein [Bifidobacterium bifidum]|uniref:hypothetical protein n=1 Tax=Bifidobacterium bifidum TaxID=1681 RepID=UPI003D0250A9
MPITPTKTLIVTIGEEGVPVIGEPVRLINPDGTPFGGVRKQAAEAPLDAASELPAVTAKVNAILAKLKTSGLLA